MDERTQRTIREVAEELGLTVMAGKEGLGQVVTGAQVSDLLSYVMAQGRAGDLWVTIQTHPNIIAVAALARLAGIVVAAGFDPGEETLDRADEENTPVLVGEESAFRIAGRLYELGVR